MARPRRHLRRGDTSTSLLDLFSGAARRKTSQKKELDSTETPSSHATLVPLETKYHGFDRRGPPAAPVRKKSHLADAAEKVVAKQAAARAEMDAEVEMVLPTAKGKSLLVLEGARSTAAQAWVAGPDYRAGGTFVRKSTGSLANPTSLIDIKLEENGLSFNSMDLEDLHDPELCSSGADSNHADCRRLLGLYARLDASDEDLSSQPSSALQSSGPSHGSLPSTSSFADDRVSMGSRISEVTVSSSASAEVLTKQAVLANTGFPTAAQSSETPKSGRLSGILRHLHSTAGAKEDDRTTRHDHVETRPRNQVPRHRSSFRSLVMVDGIPSIAQESSANQPTARDAEGGGFHTDRRTKRAGRKGSRKWSLGQT